VPRASLAAKLRGSHREALEALRDELADSMEDADPNVKPQFAARIQAVLTELASLPDPKGTAVDDLVARRAARRAAADAKLRPKQRRRTERRA
jgi:hypothetical protein